MADIAIPFDRQRSVAGLTAAGVRERHAEKIVDVQTEQLVELLKVLVTKAELAEYDANHHKDLAAIRERIAALEASQKARFADVDTEFAKVSTRFAEVMASQKAGFADVDTEFAKVSTRFADVDTKFAEVMERISALEASQKAGYAELAASQKAGYADVNQRIAESDANHQKDLRVLADRIAAVDAKIDARQLQLIMWMVVVGIGIAGFVVALLRLWPPG